MVKFQAPEGTKDSLALFPERFYFVTSLKEETPSEVVHFYQQRGEAERVFGDFVQTLRPTFRHVDVTKNKGWALLVALAHNVLADLRDLLPRAQKPAKEWVERSPAFLPDHVVFGFHRLSEDVRLEISPLSARVRDLALRIPIELKRAGKKLALYLRPDILAPTWLPALCRNEASSIAYRTTSGGRK